MTQQYRALNNLLTHNVLTNKKCERHIAYYFVMVVCLCLLYFLYYIYSMVQVADGLNEELVNELPPKSEVLLTSVVPLVSHTHIQLPKPPEVIQLESQPSTELPSKAPDKVFKPTDISGQLLPLQQSSLVRLEPNSFKTKQQANSTNVTQSDNLTANKHYQQIYNQITQSHTNENSSVVELAWPSNQQQYKKVLQYFEQCLGTGFGIIEQQKKLLVLQPISNNQAFSSWLRLTSSLSVNEQRLLVKYKGLNTSFVPVRLFPEWFDQRLAQLLSYELKGQPLTSFFAQFHVQVKSASRSLLLNTPQINGIKVAKHWQLHQC